MVFDEIDEFLNFAANKQSRLGLKKLEDEIRNAVAQQQSNKGLLSPNRLK